MKKLNKPTRIFNLQTPSYAKKIKIIMKMKSSASPCPNDAISIILQSYNITITSGKNNANCMESKKTFPKILRSGVIVVAHKNNDPGKPENFSPITL